MEIDHLTEGSMNGFGNDNALSPCDVILNPTDLKYDESIRQFQGCPTIAITKGGRIFAGWYSGGTIEPDIENYNLLTYSDDDCKSFTKPILVIPSSIERMVHALDIQLWTAPNGALWIFWVQNNAFPEKPEYKETLKMTQTQPSVCRNGWRFPDMRHTLWAIICEDPDAKELTFTKPRMLCTGFLRCKPTVLSTGRWIFFPYDQLNNKYAYALSDDEGKTITRYYATEKISTQFDEAMAYEKNDGSVRMFARTGNAGEIAQIISHDQGATWTNAALTGIASPNTRFYLNRTPSGKVLLVNNDDAKTRKNMTVYLSEDDGATWKYKKCIDTRIATSYPDVDFYNGKIYLIYDRERVGEKEILLAKFTEGDIINPEAEIEIKIISRP